MLAPNKGVNTCCKQVGVVKQPQSLHNMKTSSIGLAILIFTIKLLLWAKSKYTSMQSRSYCKWNLNHMIKEIQFRSICHIKKKKDKKKKKRKKIKEKFRRRKREEKRKKVKNLTKYQLNFLHVILPAPIPFCLVLCLLVLSFKVQKRILQWWG